MDTGTKARQVDAEHRCPRRDAGHVQASRAHGLDLGGVGIGAVPLDLLAGELAHVGHELDEHVLIDRRILDRGVGEDEGIGVDPLARIRGRVGDQVLVVVAVALVEIAARAFGGP